MEPQDGMYFPDYIKAYVEREQKNMEHFSHYILPRLKDYKECLDLLARAGVVIDCLSKESANLFRHKCELENSRRVEGEWWNE